ncbi:MAG: hypothetical protein WEC34_02985 [Acidimicrobiia bacterium]
MRELDDVILDDLYCIRHPVAIEIEVLGLDLHCCGCDRGSEVS